MPDQLDLSKFKGLGAQPAAPAEASPSGDKLDLSKFPQAAPAAAAPPSTPGFFERMGGLRGLGAMGVRGLAGLLSAEGSLPGAGIAGLGETLAETIEGSPLSPARIATESAIGAVPFGKIVKGGRALESMLKSGAMGAVGSGARELAAGEPLDPAQIAVGGGIGALTGGLGAAWLGREKPVNYEVQTFGKTSRPITITGTGKGVTPPVAPTQEAARGVPVMGTPAEASGRVQRVMAKEVAAEAKAAKQATKDAADAAAAQKIAEAREGLIPKQSVSESVSAPIEGGRERLSTRWVPPPAEEGIGEALADSPGAAKDIHQEILRPEQPEPPMPKADLAAQVPEGADIPPTPELTSARRGRTANERFNRGIDKSLEQAGFAGPQEPGPVPEEPFRVNEQVQPQAEAPATPAPTPPSEPSSPLMQLLSPDTPWRGQRYGAVNELFKQGQASEEERALAGMEARAERLKQGTPVSSPTQVAPSEPAMESAGAGPTPAGQPVPDWVQEQSGIVDKLKALMGGESGSAGAPKGPRDPEAGYINPGLLKFLSGASGAALGAPIGAHFDPEDPGGGMIKGALAGGVLGYAATGGGQELINWRNAGLLSGPAQIKKPLSDLGAYIGLMAEKGASGDAQTARNLATEALRAPTNIMNYLRGFRDPTLAQHVIGDMPKESAGALGMVTRPFSGAQYATQQAMERAGVSLPEARQTLMLGEPESELGKWWLKGQQFAPVRAVRPFARIATNIFERGLQRTPGLNLIPGVGGDPKTLWGRTAIGAGAGALGYLTGAADKTSAEMGQPVSPLRKSLRRALVASYGLPFAGMEAIGGQEPKELYYMIPGISQVLPPPAADDTAASYAQKRAKAWLEQMLPAGLGPDTGTTR